MSCNFSSFYQYFSLTIFLKLLPFSTSSETKYPYVAHTNNPTILITIKNHHFQITTNAKTMASASSSYSSAQSEWNTTLLLAVQTLISDYLHISR